MQTVITLQCMLQSTQYRFIIILLLCVASISCSSNDEGDDAPFTPTPQVEDTQGTTDGETNTSQYAPIDFSNWKVTLPVDENNNGSPDEYQPAQLVNFGYQNIEAITPFMYDDIEDTSLVFHVYPASSTANSSYSRTELRELINPSNSRENWTLAQGGILSGNLKMEDISQDGNSSNDYHRTIVMQIHGIISEEDMETHGFSSNNGPPLLKMYWKDGYIWSHKKSLVDESTEGDALLDTSSDTWEDIKDNMGYVGFEPFSLSITASDARLEIQLNDQSPLIYEDVSLEKWPFENYFKAGNYLTSTDAQAFATLKYYNIEVTH